VPYDFLEGFESKLGQLDILKSRFLKMCMWVMICNWDTIRFNDSMKRFEIPNDMLGTHKCDEHFYYTNLMCEMMLKWYGLKMYANLATFGSIVMQA